LLIYKVYNNEDQVTLYPHKKSTCHIARAGFSVTLKLTIVQYDQNCMQPKQSLIN